jgi:autotransporter-associated beta strand protein
LQNLAIGNNTLSIGSNGRNTTYSGNFTGTDGSIVKVGNGTLTLTGTGHAYTGGTTIQSGTLAGYYNSIIGNVSNSATLLLTGSTGGNFTASVSGAGDLIKSGSSRIAITTAQTYTGNTTVQAGTLALSGSGALDSTEISIAIGAGLAAENSGLSSNSSVTNVGTFTVNASNEIGELVGSGNVVLNNATLTTGGLNSDTLVTGTISGTGSLTKNGNGSLTLTSSNTYTGGTDHFRRNALHWKWDHKRIDHR